MRARTAALLLLLLGLVLGTAPGALAHGKTGKVEVLTAEAPDGKQARIEVGVRYDDADPAEEALVTVTLRSPDGVGLGPVVLGRISGGRYGGTIPVSGPGTWGVEVISIDPNVRGNDTFVVPEPGAPVPTTATQASTSTTRVPGRPIEPERSEDGVAWAAVAAVAGVVAAAAIAAALVTRRRRRP